MLNALKQHCVESFFQLISSFIKMEVFPKKDNLIAKLTCYSSLEVLISNKMLPKS